MKMGISKALLLVTVVLMDFLVGMEFDLFVPSFPEIQSHFQLSPFWVEATLSVNFIGFCLSLLFVGDVADRFGKRPIILIGLATFFWGSILSLWAPSFFYFLLGRFLQGAGIAAPSILSFLLIADLFELKKQQFYMAMLNGIMNISIACAPVIGSYITLYYNWQGNFIALLLFSLIVLIMSVLIVPRDRQPATQHESVGYGGILQSKPLMLLVLHFAIMFVPWWIFVGISPLLYIEDLGLSLSDYGYYTGSLALAFALGSIAYGFVVNRFDQRRMLYVSNAIFVLSFVTLAYITLIDCRSPVFITLTFLLFIVGQVIPITILFPYTLKLVPHAGARTAAIIQAGRLILSSFGLQVTGHYYAGSFQQVGSVLLVFILLTIVTLHLVMQKHNNIATQTLTP